MVSYKTILIAILCLSLLAGCTGYFDGNTDPRPGSSDVDIRLPSLQEGNYSSNGTVSFQYAAETETSFDEVTLCAYNLNGDLLTSTVIGDFVSSYTSVEFQFETEEKPYFIFVDHPKFRNHGIVPEIFDWRDHPPLVTGGYPEDYIDEFEYVPPTEPGECDTTQPVEG